MKSVLACCAENETHAPDSVLMTGVCGHKVWVSQSGLQAMREMDLEVSCIACLPPDIPVVGHAGIKKEVEKVIGKEAAESIMADLQDPAKLNLLILASRLSKKETWEWR